MRTKPGVVDGENLKGGQGENQTNTAGQTGEQQAGVRELQIQAQHPGHHEQVGDIGVGQDIQHLMLEPHLDRDDIETTLSQLGRR